MLLVCLAGAGQRALEALLGLIDLVEIASGFRLGVLLGQDLVHRLGRELVIMPGAALRSLEKVLSTRRRRRCRRR